MSIHGWKFERKKKSGLFKKTKWKKKLKKKIWSWTKAKRKKNEERKEVEVQFELYCVKYGGFDVIWKEKLWSTSLYELLCALYIFSS